ncbi:hypothetical protein [Sphingorhabdus sp. Alg239-R122]|uniref:hypothetical protein n=1 Tax=Sphingorhabdus sp. Alg239-R122 TaxID=2305989 RepID=UPI0013DD285B|nr:hypothetical protein [Sphingorhabdus sp. Alg239-R122]
MNDTDKNYGEQKVKNQNRKMLKMVAFSLVIGGVIGTLLRNIDGGAVNLLTGNTENISLNPLTAILVAAAIFIGLIGFPLYSLRHVDELERRININATAISGLAVLGAFPVWLLLAIGGLLPHPTAYGMFLIAMASGFVSYLWLKFRP